MDNTRLVITVNLDERKRKAYKEAGMHFRDITLTNRFQFIIFLFPQRYISKALRIWTRRQVGKNLSWFLLK